MARPTPETMWCCICGHWTDGPYETRTAESGEEFPICPKCRSDNTGGYRCFAPLRVWPAEGLPPRLRRVVMVTEVTPTAADAP